MWQQRQPDRQLRQQRSCDFDAGFNWIMTNRQELRLKLQAIGLECGAAAGLSHRRRRQRDRTRRAGRRLQRAQPRRSDPLPLRARAAVLSICGVWPRRIRPGTDRARIRGGLLRDSFSLRDDEQLLVKLSYRFET